MATVYEQMAAEISAAAAAFESRWTLRSLRHVDADLYEALIDQRNTYHEACLFDEPDREIRRQGRATVRGWLAAIAAMEKAAAPEDAVMVGHDPASGMIVAIGDQRAAEKRVLELHGGTAVFLTPDEVAAMFAGLQSVATVKALWPGAEIIRSTPKIERYPDEPAQEDV